MRQEREIGSAVRCAGGQGNGSAAPCGAFPKRDGGLQRSCFYGSPGREGHSAQGRDAAGNSRYRNRHTSLLPVTGKYEGCVCRYCGTIRGRLRSAKKLPQWERLQKFLPIDLQDGDSIIYTYISIRENIKRIRERAAPPGLCPFGFYNIIQPETI